MDRSEARLGDADGGLLVLVALLVTFAALKLVQTPPRDYYGPDGGTYFQVARHVAEGDGLVTSVSLYHQGLKHLPSPTTIYPLWPLVLGWAGRLIGLERAARLLPELLYVIDLGLLYALARRLASAWGCPQGRVVASVPLDLGHVAVVLFGLNAIFIRYSSLPYTEPLALALTFGGLLLVGWYERTGSLLASTLAGASAGAAYLARTSMIVVPVAVVGALVLARRGEASWRATACALLGTAVVVVPWLAYLYSFVHVLHPMMLVDVFTLNRETPELEPVVWIVPITSWSDLQRFAVDGLIAAFRIGGPSYVRSFGVVAYAVPLAALCLLLSKRLRGAFTVSDGRILIVATGLCGLGLAVMAHAAHSESDFALRWAFHHRHGLPYILLIISALASLLPLVVPRDRGSGEGSVRAVAVLRFLVLGMIALSFAASAPRAYGEFFYPRGRSPTPPEVDLAAWLAAQPRMPVVIASRAPKHAVISRAGFHWIGCSDDPEQVRRLFLHTGADYLVVRRSDRRCPFMRGLEPELELVQGFRRGRPPLELYRWRGKG